MRLLKRAEAAALVRKSPATLADWAYRGIGPPFFRVGREALYDEAELLEWLRSQRANFASRARG